MLQEFPEVAVLPDIHHFLHMPRLSVPEARNPFSRTDAAPQHRDLVYPVKGGYPAADFFFRENICFIPYSAA